MALLLRFLVAEAVSWSSCLLTSSNVKDYDASLRLTQELQLSLKSKLELLVQDQQVVHQL